MLYVASSEMIHMFLDVQYKLSVLFPFVKLMQVSNFCKLCWVFFFFCKYVEMSGTNRAAEHYTSYNTVITYCTLRQGLCVIHI